jgi:hypothetical protein
MKTIIKALADNRVYIKFDSYCGITCEYEFYATANGGYVRYGQDGKQICERLSTKGPTLSWSGKSPLVGLIRREYQNMRRAERRESDKLRSY